ncbi:TPA: hypothetical protein ACIFCJ_003511 [Acinetobacter baumannii]
MDNYKITATGRFDENGEHHLTFSKGSEEKDPALISGADALRALIEGLHVEMSDSDLGMDWTEICVKDGDFYGKVEPCLWMFLNQPKHIEFRLKPQTIKLELEIPAPFQPKEGEECCYISDESIDGYHTVSYNSERYSGMIFGLYRPSDIEKVVALFRSAFGGAS